MEKLMLIPIGSVVRLVIWTIVIVAVVVSAL